MLAEMKSLDSLTERGGEVLCLLLRMRGIVQGVGFRPTVYSMALSRGLSGWVRNNPEGVEILLEGAGRQIASFVQGLLEEPPPLARIEDWDFEENSLQGLQGFAILESGQSSKREVLVSPDIAPCEDCLREMRDPGNRRFRYPFINCTNCGPRFTIIGDLPYDRPLTSMKEFPLCAKCKAEYEDPLDRRFHAQPNACGNCGPQVRLLDKGGEEISSEDPLALAAEALEKGKILALRGLGGFQLAVDAGNEEAVKRLRARKRRHEKPFALMVRNRETAQQLVILDENEERVLLDRRRPILLARKKAGIRIADSVAPRNGFLGIMLPCTPLHELLLELSPPALVMSSGNLSEEPIAASNEEALAALSGIADLFLVHDREILRRCDDSVIRWMDDAPAPVRRSRGLVPEPVLLPFECPPVLAVGPEQKNTLCLVRGQQAFLSQHIGDLENLETLNFFREAIAGLQQVLEVKPRFVAHDLHPRYLSTTWALEESGLEPIAVQHHHAHMASCMAENRHSDPCLALCLDGTGYGEDGKIWGGELLSGDFMDYQRRGHLWEARIPGAEAAIREPWRMAVGWLAELDPLSRRQGLKLLEAPEEDKQNVLRLAESGVNSPETSSMGRLFDTVSALIGLRGQARYEGQGAVELEGILHEQGMPEAAGEDWDLPILRDSGRSLLDPRPLLVSLIEERSKGLSPAECSLRFHRGLVRGLADWVKEAALQQQLQCVALSGGCFMNRILLVWLKKKLEEEGLRVLTQKRVPANDGGLALGQAVIAARRVMERK